MSQAKSLAALVAAVEVELARSQEQTRNARADNARLHEQLRAANIQLSEFERLTNMNKPGNRDEDDEEILPVIGKVMDKPVLPRVANLVRAPVSSYSGTVSFESTIAAQGSMTFSLRPMLARRTTSLPKKVPPPSRKRKRYSYQAQDHDATRFDPDDDIEIPNARSEDHDDTFIPEDDDEAASVASEDHDDIYESEDGQESASVTSEGHDDTSNCEDDDENASVTSKDHNDTSGSEDESITSRKRHRTEDTIEQEELLDIRKTSLDPPSTKKRKHSLANMTESADFKFLAVISWNRNGEPGAGYDFTDLDGRITELWEKIEEVKTIWEREKGLGWSWELEKRDPKRNPHPCITRKMHGKPVRWRAGCEGKFACKNCVVLGLPCFTWNGADFLLLPLHEEDRVEPVKEDYEIRWWLNL
ncbi:hypothetical protein LTR62_007215 [Meristemomyces frigidus]|uniref:Uncharacterized protein n=1 Tax=Meristemomyces frigidus TaxID=1508187 RepID=A0AAN7TC10_9PEZI|nr:hypothetical protein LTR62_007215 [Meristemomyces frigidus]